MSDIFKRASKQSLRFLPGSGVMTADDLWQLPLTVLDAYAIQLKNELKNAETESFIKPAAPSDREKTLRFEIVRDIIETRVADLDKATKSRATKAKNAKIREAIANKKDSVLQEASLEDLEKMIEEEES